MDQLIFDREMVGDRVLFTASIQTPCSFPRAVFIFKMKDDGTPDLTVDGYQGIVDVEDLTKILEYKGSAFLPKHTGNLMCRVPVFKVLLENGTDLNSVETRILKGVRRFKLSYLSSKTTRVVNI